MKKIVLEDPMQLRTVENYIRRGYSFDAKSFTDSLLCMTRGDETILLDKSGQDYKKPDLTLNTYYVEIISMMGLWEIYAQSRDKSHKFAIAFLGKLQEKFTEEEWRELMEQILTEEEKE